MDIVSMSWIASSIYMKFIRSPLLIKGSLTRLILDDHWIGLVFSQSTYTEYRYLANYVLNILSIPIYINMHV